MTRKDYVKFAAMLKAKRSFAIQQTLTHNLWQDHVNDTADIFADDNPNFDRARFLAACGVES